MLPITEEEKAAAARQRIKQTFNTLTAQAGMLLKTMREGSVATVQPAHLKEILGADYDFIVTRLDDFSRDPNPAPSLDEPAPPPPGLTPLPQAEAYTTPQ